MTDNTNTAKVMLLPCALCGANCSPQLFNGPSVYGTVYFCSKHERLQGSGGSCHNCQCTPEAWNQRTEQALTELGGKDFAIPAEGWKPNLAQATAAIEKIMDGDEGFGAEDLARAALASPAAPEFFAENAKKLDAPEGLASELRPFMQGFERSNSDESTLVPIDLLDRILTTLRNPDAAVAEAVERCARIADHFEHQENGRSWDKRQADRDDNFNCARASAAQHIAKSIRTTDGGEHE